MQVSQSEELAAPSAEPAKVLEHVEQLWAQVRVRVRIRVRVRLRMTFALWR